MNFFLISKDHGLEVQSSGYEKDDLQKGDEENLRKEHDLGKEYDKSPRYCRRL